MKIKTLKDMNLFFSDRVRLGKEFLVWAKKNNVEVCPMSVIGWIQNKIRARDKQEAIKLVKYLLKLTKTKIIKMPKITLEKKRILVEHGHFDGQCIDANHQPTQEFFSALILCKLHDLTVRDLK